MDRTNIIRLIESDDRFDADLQAFQFGYINYETMLHRVIPVLMYGRLYVAEAEQIISDNPDPLIFGEDDYRGLYGPNNQEGNTNENA